jgi:hypothetical protein
VTRGEVVVRLKICVGQKSLSHLLDRRVGQELISMKTSWLSRLTQPKSPSRRRPLRLQSTIEGLEDRSLMSATVYVVPMVQATDITHRHSVTDAMTFAGLGGTVIIEPGATPDLGGVNVTMSDMTIQGDPNVGWGNLPHYDLAVTANNTTLINMNLGDVTIISTANHLTIDRSEIGSFTEHGAVSGAGSNTLTHNVINGAVDLQGNSGLFQTTGDVIAFNHFVSKAPVMLELTNSTSTSIHDNTFVGDTSGQVGIEVRSNSDLVTIANNSITLTGALPPLAIYLINTGGAAGNILGAKVLNNELSTGGVGDGLYMNIFGTGAGFAAQVEGNDFHGNKVGIDVNGVPGATGAGNIDVGGGSNGFGTSKGSNNFRGFDGVGGHYAIALHNSDAGTSVQAKSNIFDTGINANKVVKDSFNGGGTGAVFVTPVLDPNHAFVQNLYLTLLGKAGDLTPGGEIDQWVAKLPKLGRKGVAKAIMNSDAALGRVVDKVFSDYLGRNATATEMTTWVGLLKKGLTLSRFESKILSLPEYMSRINTDYVQSLYLNVLHRPATATELAKGYAQLPSLGLRGFADTITGGKLHRIDFATNLYRDLLHREPVGMEVTTLTTKSSNLFALELLVLSSDEYYAHG